MKDLIEISSFCTMLKLELISLSKEKRLQRYLFILDITRPTWLSTAIVTGELARVLEVVIALLIGLPQDVNNNGYLNDVHHESSHAFVVRCVNLRSLEDVYFVCPIQKHWTIQSLFKSLCYLDWPIIAKTKVHHMLMKSGKTAAHDGYTALKRYFLHCSVFVLKGH